MYQNIKNRTIILSIFCLFSAIFSQEVRTGNVKGAVVDGDDRSAIEGARVILNTGVIGGVALDPVFTDANGEFDFNFSIQRNNLRISLFVTKEGYLPANETGIRLGETDSVEVSVEMVKENVPTDTTEVTSTGTIQGRVLADSLSGEPVSGAKVILSSSGGVAGTQIATGITDEEGVYSFTGVKADGQTRYSISASAPGFAPESATRITLDSGEVDTADIVLMTMGADSWLVLGTVVKDSADGDPLPGALIELSAVFGQETRYSGFSDENGDFQILVPARVFSYSMTATLNGFVQSGSMELMVSGDSTLASAVVMQIDTNAAPVGYPGIVTPSDITVQYMSDLRALRLQIPKEGWDREKGAALDIYDMQGKQIRHFQGYDLRQYMDVGKLAKGLYFWNLKATRTRPWVIFKYFDIFKGFYREYFFRQIH